MLSALGLWLLRVRCTVWRRRYVRTAEMAADADRAVRDGAIRILPAARQAEWHRWLAEPHDWYSVVGACV